MKAIRFTLAAALAAAAWAQVPNSSSQITDQRKIGPVLEKFANSQLTLEPNRGQAPQGVDYVATGLSHRFLLSATGTTVQLSNPLKHRSEKVRLELVGANPSAASDALDRVAFTSSYWTRQDPNNRQVLIPNYARVRYRQAWPGIDVTYYGNRFKLEYDLIVAPHANPGAIRLKVDSGAGLSLTSKGDIVVRTAAGNLIQHKPVAYQTIDGQRREVTASYSLVSRNEIKVRLGKYDNSQELIIDPTLALAVEEVNHIVNTIALDGAGNIYLGGNNNDPPPGGLVFVLKSDSTGQALSLDTFLGVSIGTLAMTPAGIAYVTGTTSNGSFRVTPSGYQQNIADVGGSATDAFFVQYVPGSNTLMYSTFFGGVGNDQGLAVTFDGSGHGYITGQTVGGAGFPSTVGPAYNGGASDAFVAEFSPSFSGAASLTFSTFVGGNGADSATSIALDGSNNIYIGGSTASPSFSFHPTSSTGYNTSKTTTSTDGFILKLNNTASAASYLTYLPLAPINGIAVDSHQFAYVTGAVDGTTNALVTTASGYQLTNGGNGCGGPTCTDAFLSKYDTTTNGTASLLYSTYLGGNLADLGLGVAVDSNGNAYVVGQTSSTNFPIVNALSGLGTYQTGGVSDGFVAKINTLGAGVPSLVYSTFLASGTDGNSLHIPQVAGVVAAGCTVYVGGVAPSLPLVPPPTTSEQFPGFLAKIVDNVPLFTVTKSHTGNFTQGQQNATYNVSITNSGCGATSGTVTVTDTLPTGLSLVSMSGTGWSCSANSCNRSDALAANGTYPAITVTVNVGANATSPQVNTVAVSGGGSATISATDSTVINPGAATLSVTKTHVGNFIQGQQNATYTVTVSNSTGVTSGTVTVTDTIPSGLTLVSMAGTGWNCVSNSCTRSDALAGGASYPSITVTVNVAGNASSPQVNQVAVSGGGSAGANTSDSTNIVPPSLPSLAITKSHTGNFAQNQQGATYTITVTNQAGAGPSAGQVTVTDTVPSGLTLVSLAGTGWSCSGNSCNRSDVLASGSSYPAITATVNVAPTASSPQVNQATVSGGGSPTTSVNDSTVITAGTPTLTVNRKTLNFGFKGTVVTSPQQVVVGFTGASGVAWTATPSAGITVTPASGTGTGTFQVSVTSTTPSGTVTVSAPGSLSTPQQITVNVAAAAGSPVTPFGSFDTPINNSTGVVGAIGVTGWALDGIEVANVAISRDPVAGEGSNRIFIGNAVFVADARPDVQAQYPNFPYNYRAGWGYQLLTNFLPNQGNGTFTLHAVVTNTSGVSFELLPPKTITVDDAHASKPFGTIDTPAQGGTASGTQFVNFGWALTPQPQCIPTDGSTITVVIDGVPGPHPVYNQPRQDIQTLFPGYCNTNGAVGYYLLNTTTLTNGVHTISWNAFDNLGRGEGLGSRYFNVLNTGGGAAAPEQPPTPDSINGPVRLRKGISLHPRETELAPMAGIYSVELEESSRMELTLGASRGYLVAGGDEMPLPLGSSLLGGVFYWQPLIGFLGDFDFVFERPDGSRVPLHVQIVPKHYAGQ